MSTRGLREALKAMPKALTEGEQLGQLRTDVSAANARANSSQNAQEATQTGATGKHLSKTKNVSQTGKSREMRPLWKVILGVR